MHGTSRLWKPRAETEAMRTRRETQRESQRASQRSLEGMKHAGMMTERQDNKVESVKRFPGAGDASLRTFGSSKWGVQATKELPRHHTSYMADFGVVAVPNWQGTISTEECHADGSSLDVHPRGNAVWLGTRYETESLSRQGWAAPRARVPDPEDPRIKYWRGTKSMKSLAEQERVTHGVGDFVQFDSKAHGVRAPSPPQPDVVPAEWKEVEELKAMGIGTWIPAAEDASASSPPKEEAPRVPMPKRPQAADAVEKDDISWVTAGPWTHAAKLASRAASVSKALRDGAKHAHDTVPSLSFEHLTPNSKGSVAARLKAPIHASG